jgi:quinol monooxygenase YgiN
MHQSCAVLPHACSTAPPIELAIATVTHLSPDCPESLPPSMTAQTVAPTAITATRTAAAISTARRSRRVSGSVGGVLPVLVVWGSFVRSLGLILESCMPITVLLELKFKTESLAEAREVFRRELVKTRAFDGNLVTDVLVDEDDESHWVIYESWESVEHDEAYRRFRAGEGKIADLPPLLAAPPVKTRYTTTDV